MRFQASIQILLIVISVAIIMTVLRPEFSEIQAMQDQLAEYNNALDKADQYNRALQEKISQANNLPNTDLAALDQYVPNRVDIVRVSRDVVNIVEGSGLLLIDVEVGESSSVTVENANAGVSQSARTGGSLEEEAKRQLAVQPFTIEAIGTYTNMKSLLRAVEQNAYPMRIVGISFTNQSESDSRLLSYTIDVETYALNAQ
ncbi:MAG: hypothetical protein R3B69_01635 [Candidatus Paceibacterota bacterium]